VEGRRKDSVILNERKRCSEVGFLFDGCGEFTGPEGPAVSFSPGHRPGERSGKRNSSICPTGQPFREANRCPLGRRILDNNLQNSWRCPGLRELLPVGAAGQSLGRGTQLRHVTVASRAPDRWGFLRSTHPTKKRTIPSSNCTSRSRKMFFSNFPQMGPLGWPVLRFWGPRAAGRRREPRAAGRKTFANPSFRKKDATQWAHGPGRDDHRRVHRGRQGLRPPADAAHC